MKKEPMLQVQDNVLLNLYDIRDSSRALVKFLRANTGDSADWPIRIISDEDIAPELARLLTTLEKALEP